MRWKVKLFEIWIRQYGLVVLWQADPSYHDHGKPAPSARAYPHHDRTLRLGLSRFEFKDKLHRGRRRTEWGLDDADHVKNFLAWKTWMMLRQFRQ